MDAPRHTIHVVKPRVGLEGSPYSRAHFVACFTAANRFDLSVGAAVELLSFPFPLPLVAAAAVALVPADTAPGCADVVDPVGGCDDDTAC